MTDSPSLTPLAQGFIQHFGEMGSRWGINRTVGQIYALLYIVGHPLNAEEIAHHLHFSRSNISMGLKELQAWRLIKLIHQPQDRREYFSPPGDVWDIFKILMEERRRREIEPTLTMLRDALLDPSDLPEDAETLQRMREMHELVELSSKWFDDIQKLDRDTLISLMKMGTHIQKLINIRNKFRLPGKKNPVPETDLIE